MSILEWLFLVASLAVVVDFATDGFALARAARGVNPASRPFVAGLGWLLLSVAGFNAFWLLIVFAGPALRLAESPPLQNGATGLFVVLCLAAIAGHRRWRRKIVPAVNGASGQREAAALDRPSTPALRQYIADLQNRNATLEARLAEKESNPPRPERAEGE